MAAKRILVTGGSGQVGGALVELAKLKCMNIFAPTRTELDLTNHDALRAIVDDQDWYAIINCAAYTAVDRAESEPERARLMNAEAPGILAEATGKRGIPIFHISTDYVFDGASPRPYREDDPVNPLCVYGATKLAGEQAVRANNPRHVILRTSWVVSAMGANFINTMLRLGAERDEVRVVNDQIGCPTNARDIAAALLLMVENEPKYGTWHFVNSGAASWHDLAAHVFAFTHAKGIATPSLVPIPTTDYPTPAMRPANSRLSTDKYALDFGIRPRAWQDAIDDILVERLGPKG
jgi:dTDP-4-dehydrorhamnose reductase